ncbi:MAG: hypothetical protein LBI60_02725 [Bacteroidales bacterium]|jgi:hypothetical protein|nr:hypothetical protein [Bacteroidales bacterium]
MKQKKIEQARNSINRYYEGFIEKCLEVHGIDMTTTMDDCVAAGYNAAVEWTKADIPPELYKEVIAKIKFTELGGGRNVTVYDIGMLTNTGWDSVKIQSHKGNNMPLFKSTWEVIEWRDID